MTAPMCPRMAKNSERDPKLKEGLYGGAELKPGIYHIVGGPASVQELPILVCLNTSRRSLSLGS